MTDDETKGPHDCEMEGCISRAYAHVVIQQFDGPIVAKLCKYHLKVATQIKPVVTEGHPIGPDCGMPGADWYRLQDDDMNDSMCKCAEGAEEIEVAGGQEEED